MRVFLAPVWIVFMYVFVFKLLPCPSSKTSALPPLLVMSLKRLLVGSISITEDLQPDGENEEEQSERTSQEMDTSQSTGRPLCFVSGE